MKCPECGNEGKGSPIPDEYFEHYTDGSCEKAQQRSLKTYGKPLCFCFAYGDKAPEDRFFSTHIGHEFPEYDGVLVWSGTCDHSWPRFSEQESPRFHKLALEIIAGWV